MKICDLHTGRIRLTRAAKRLRDQWQETQACWRDQNAHDFEEHHLQPLAPQITLLLAAVQRLNEVLEHAERGCSEETVAE